MRTKQDQDKIKVNLDWIYGIYRIRKGIYSFPKTKVFGLGKENPVNLVDPVKISGLPG